MNSTTIDCTLKDHSMDIKNLLQEFIEDNGSVGASVAIIENGRTSFYTYEKKSVNGNDLVSKDTLFEIGSITKVFTTLLLADMESQGRVKLDEPVEKYLPEVKIPERNGKKNHIPPLGYPYFRTSSYAGQFCSERSVQSLLRLYS